MGQYRGVKLDGVSWAAGKSITSVSAASAAKISMALMAASHKA